MSDTDPQTIETITAALRQAYNRIERLEDELGARDAKLRSLTDRGPLLVLLQGQADAKIAEITARASVMENAINTLGPAAAPLVALAEREIARFCGRSAAPINANVGAAISAIMSNRKLTWAMQCVAGDGPWTAFLEFTQKIVGGAALPETVASRYHEARKTCPDMLPLQDFCEQAVAAELARRGKMKASPRS